MLVRPSSEREVDLRAQAVHTYREGALTPFRLVPRPLLSLLCGLFRLPCFIAGDCQTCLCGQEIDLELATATEGRRAVVSWPTRGRFHRVLVGLPGAQGREGVAETAHESGVGEAWWQVNLWTKSCAEKWGEFGDWKKREKGDVTTH